MKSTSIFLAAIALFVAVCLSSATALANSFIGHNTVALYIFHQLERDAGFMPGIQGEHRRELIGKGVDNISSWKDLTNAQKAFIHGVNFPDAFPLMDRIHHDMPLEILCAMYSLAGKVPEVRRREPDSNKEFLTRMQLYMTWGAKVNLAMDKIAHKDIPDPRTHLAEHIVVETDRDIKMQNELFATMRFSPEKSDRMRAFSRDRTPYDSENYDGPERSGNGFGLPPIPFVDPGIDIRDEFVNLVLDYIKHGRDKEGTHIRDSLTKAKSLIALIRSQIGTPVPEQYRNMPSLTLPILEMLTKIDLSIPPTDAEMDAQVNLDDPALQRIGRTDAGRTLINNAKR